MPGTGLVINGTRVEVPNVDVYNWFDNKAYRILLGQDGRTRKETVQCIVMHTTRGLPANNKHAPAVLLPGKGPTNNYAFNNIKFWRNDPGQASAHLIIGFDGVVICAADLEKEACFHAGGHLNDFSIGIEICQTAKGEIYQEQLDKLILLVTFICEKFNIPQQIHTPYYKKALERCLKDPETVFGVIGHRDCSNNRGEGDPTNFPYTALRDSGYLFFDFEKKDDISYWRGVQRDLNMNHKAGLVQDGMPGPKTMAAVKKFINSSGRPY